MKVDTVEEGEMEDGSQNILSWVKGDIHARQFDAMP